MKTLHVAVVFMLLSLSAYASHFVNIKSHIQTDRLPDNTPLGWSSPTPEMIWSLRQADGWRRVVQTNAVPDGFRAGSWLGKELSKETAALDPTNLINLADEQAAATAEEEANKADDVAAQINLEKVTPAMLKGLVGALAMELKKQGIDIKVENVMLNMASTVPAEIDHQTSSVVVKEPSVTSVSAGKWPNGASLPWKATGAVGGGLVVVVLIWKLRKHIVA